MSRPIRAALAAFLFREMTPRKNAPSLGIGGVLIAVVVFVSGVGMLYGASIVGGHIDEACISPTTFKATKSLASYIILFLPHSNEGGRLIAGGDFDRFTTIEGGPWPGAWHATRWRNSDPDKPGTTSPLWDNNVNQNISWGNFKPPLEFHAFAALNALALCVVGVRFVTREHYRIRSIQLICVVGLVLIMVTLPAAFSAWSGPQLVRIFWEQVYGLSGHGSVVAQDRVWVQPALCETSGLLVFGIIYAACLFAGAWWAAKFLLGVKGLSHSHRRIMRCDGVAHCGRCGHQLDNLTTCPECGLDQSDLPPRGWPWNSRWFRTQRARRVALLLLLGTAVTVSAALPLIVGVAQVLLKRL